MIRRFEISISELILKVTPLLCTTIALALSIGAITLSNVAFVHLSIKRFYMSLTSSIHTDLLARLRSFTKSADCWCRNSELLPTFSSVVTNSCKRSFNLASRLRASANSDSPSSPSDPTSWHKIILHLKITDSSGKSANPFGYEEHRTDQLWQDNTYIFICTASRLTLNTHLHLVLGLRICGYISPLLHTLCPNDRVLLLYT
jgi:hypothetical protein